MAGDKEKPKRYLSGFTLIELLVVISIIGFLASLAAVSINSARQKAKVAKKKAELSQLLKLVQMYYMDIHAMPANTNPGGWCTIGSGACLQELITRGYTAALPASPDGVPYYYYDYASYGMVASRMNPEEYGPGTRGWHCSAASGGVAGSAFFCLEFNK